MQPRHLIRLAALVFVVSWVAPVDNGGELGGEVRGWQAFLMALSPMWDNSVFTDVAKIFSLISALTNVLFIVSMGIALLRAERLVCFQLCGLAFSCIINAMWMQGGVLGTGYYLWLGSFVLLSISVYGLHRAQLLQRVSASLPQARPPTIGGTLDARGQ